MSRRQFLRSVSALPLAGFPYPTIHSSKQKSYSAVHFTDVTQAAGIRFHHDSAPEKRYIVESMSGGVALIDYDLDGWLDIYFTNAPSVAMALAGKKARSALYHNNHDGTFTDVTEKAGVGYPGWAMGAVVADYDNDGWPDLAVTCFGGVVLYRNNGDGTFADVTRQAGLGSDSGWATGAAFGDYDRDGWLDLFVSHYVDFHLDDLPKFGSQITCQYHGIPVQCGPAGLPGSADSLFHNAGDGSFTNVSVKAGVSDSGGSYGLGVVWTDVDQDGWPDIYVANDVGANFLYHNNRDGTFSEIGLISGVALGGDGQKQGSMGVGIGDYLHTGLPALFVTNFADQYDTLYRHDSPLFFTDVSFQSGIMRYMGPFVSWGTAFLDYDNDGWPDLLIVNGHVYPQVDHYNLGTKYAQRMLLFHNEGDGTFSEVAAECGDALLVPRVSRGAAFGDIDNDGDIDVVIENLDGSPTILRNDGGSMNNWISLKLRSKGGNRDAIGARVKVAASSLVQWDEVRSGGSYLSASDLRLHYGLGDYRNVDTVEVHWPSGRIETMRNPPVNHFLTIEEGQGVTEQAAPPRLMRSLGDHSRH